MQQELHIDYMYFDAIGMYITKLCIHTIDFLNFIETVIIKLITVEINTILLQF